MNYDVMEDLSDGTRSEFIGFEGRKQQCGSNSQHFAGQD